MLPDMVVSGNVKCAALQQAAASSEVDHDLWWTTTSGVVSSHTSAVKCRINCCFRALLKRQFIRHIIDVSRRFWSGS